MSSVFQALVFVGIEQQLVALEERDASTSQNIFFSWGTSPLTLSTLADPSQSYRGFANV